MKKYISQYYRPICLQFLMIVSSVLSAQNVPTISSDEIVKQRQKIFNQINQSEDAANDSLWYQGRIYEYRLKAKHGTPYFMDVARMAGSLSYHNIVHEDLILAYNLTTDELILGGVGSGGTNPPLVLNKSNVERFTLNHNDQNYSFRMHSTINHIHQGLKEGFYEVVFEDELSMFVKHDIDLNYDVVKEQDIYVYKKQVYLIYKNELFKINNRGNYLSAFEEYKKPLRKYMRKVSMNFNKANTQALFELCKYSKSFLDQ